VLLNSRPLARGLRSGSSQYVLASEVVNLPTSSTLKLKLSCWWFSAGEIKASAAFFAGFRAGAANPSPCHGAENYTAVCLEDGPLAPARMDQSRRSRRVPASRPTDYLLLHQVADAGRAATEEAWDNLRIHGKYSQDAGCAGGIM